MAIDPNAIGNFPDLVKLLETEGTEAIDTLRALPAGQSLGIAALGAALKDDFGTGDMPWLLALVDGLARDGLLERDGDAVRLP